MLVTASRACSCTSDARIPTRSFASRFERGSSIRKAFGSRMIARPIAALALPVREVRGLAFEEVLEPEQRCDLLYAADDFALWRPSNAEPEPQVLPHAHVRIERVVLKDHGDVAVRRFEVRHVHVADRDRAFRDLLEAGDH